MNTTRSIPAPARAFAVLAAIALVLSTFSVGSIGLVTAQAAGLSGAAARQPGIQPMAVDGSSLYYYADGQRIPLTASPDWVSVKYASPNPDQQAGALSASKAPVNRSTEARHIADPELDLLPMEKGMSTAAVLQGINAMRAMPTDFAQANPVFETGDAEMVITDEFIATFPAGEGRAKIDAINASHGVTIVKPVVGQRNTFVLQVSADSQTDALSMANLYQESGEAVSAAPNFVRILPAAPETSVVRAASSGPVPAANDTWYPDQWSLDNIQQYGTWMTDDADIDAPGAWDVTVGSPSIVIAIIDNGVELTQEDLSSKLVAGYDATGHADGGLLGAPCTAPCGKNDDAHGTNVAGLAAAASDNSKGIAGVCQGCSIMPVRIAYGDTSGNWITTDAWGADGITWAYQHGAAILNLSWGGGTASTVITNAISNARASGRSGKGSVVVAAAGDRNGDVNYPAKLDNVIAVGASNMCDDPKAASYDLCNGNEQGWASNFGSRLDLVAPGVWLDTTDRTGNAGSSPTLDGGMLGNNYFAFMNGTSGAAAIVSGVAGLVLSANTGLSATQVQTILQDNADDVNVDAYPGLDDYVGNGRVNARRAVNAAADLLSTVLTVKKAGNGNGAITSSPVGIDCGDTCSFAFNRNTVVTLTATPNTRSAFAGWSGSGCSGLGACVVTMSVARTVTATFSIQIPAKTALTAPVNGAKTNDNTPLLTWNPALYGDTYRVQISTGSGFASILQDHTGASGEVTYTATTLPDGVYYWRVRAFSATHLAGVWSNIWSFTVDTVPPAAPVLVAPLDNAILHLSPTFQWKLVPTAAKYQFEYDDDIAFGSPYIPPLQATASNKPPTLAYGTYYWRVMAFDAAGNHSPWSAVRTVFVHAPIPTRVSILLPANGLITTDTTPTITWRPAASASTYEIQIDNVSTFTSVDYSYSGIAALTYDVGPLTLGKWFYRVRAVNVSGDPGLWSYTRYLTVK